MHMPQEKTILLNIISVTLAGTVLGAILLFHAGARGTISTYKPRMAICAYHTASDPEQVPILARIAWPEYRVQCGPCEEQDFRIIPQTLLFH